MFGLVKIKDDRGAARPLYEEPWARSRRDPAVSATLREAYASASSQMAGVLLGLPLAWIGLEYVSPWVRAATSSQAAGVAGMLAFIFAGSMTVGSYICMRAARGRVRAAMLEIWRCPSCGYSLKELKVEEDGCVVCAECGGAWGRG